MARFNHFIFDIDGTLIDTEKTGILSLIDTVRDLLGRDLPYDEAYAYFGIPSSKVGPMLGYDDAESFGEEWERNFIRLSYLIKPFEGVSEMLAAVKNADRKISCVTSRNRFEFNKDVHLRELLHYFDHTVCSEDSVRHKPFPDPIFSYFAMSERDTGAKVDPSRCIYIGDTMHDCQCAHSAGCVFALADWNGKGIQGIPAEYHFTQTSDIVSLLLV